MNARSENLLSRFREDALHPVLLGVVFAALLALFHFQGNATDVTMFGRSAFG